MSEDSDSIDTRKILGSVLGAIVALVIAVMVVSTMFPIFEVTNAVTSSGTSFQECECENVSVESEMANAQEVKQNIFDIEQVDQSVIRVLVSVPETTEHRYLVMEVTYLTEDGRTIKSHREMVKVGNGEVPRGRAPRLLASTTELTRHSPIAVVVSTSVIVDRV